MVSSIDSRGWGEEILQDSFILTVDTLKCEKVPLMITGHLGHELVKQNRILGMVLSMEWYFGHANWEF